MAAHQTELAGWFRITNPVLDGWRWAERVGCDLEAHTYMQGNRHLIKACAYNSHNLGTDLPDDSKAT